MRRLVRDHHERLDGTGYPGLLPGEQVNLDTRVMTVCDVYDALISTRVYREAWTVERAVALLRAEIGQAFDERCVASLERVLQKDGLLPVAATAASRMPEPLPGTGPAAAAAAA